MSFASRAFAREDVKRRSVLVFARRYDCDDFAGLEVVDSVITDRVIWFHPVFGSSDAPISRTWDIVCDVYDDVFDFMAHRVIPDMKDWAMVEDASELIRDG